MNNKSLNSHSKDRPSLLLVTQDQFGYHIDTYEYAKGLRDKYDITYYCWDYGNPRIPLDGIKVIYQNRESNIIKRNIDFRLQLIRLLHKGFDKIFILYFVGVSIVNLFYRKGNLVCDMRTGNVRAALWRRIIFDSLTWFELLTFRNKTFISAGLAKRFGVKNYYLLPLGAHPLPLGEKDFSKLNIFYVGTFENRKLEDTVTGLGLFLKENKEEIDCQYIIVGSGTDEETNLIKDAIVEQGLEEVVTLAGYIPHDELLPLLQKANIGIAYIPITKYFDCQPATKVFEYLLSGIPVLATATQENVLVINEENGMLIQDSPAEVATALQTIHQRRFSYNPVEIQENALQYSWEGIIQNNLYPYLETIGKARKDKPNEVLTPENV